MGYDKPGLGWIGVTTALPHQREKVLVSFIEGGRRETAIATLTRNRHGDCIWTQDSEWVDVEGGMYSGATKVNERLPVTHWQPLLAPPSDNVEL